MFCPPARSRLLLGAAGLALMLAGARPAAAAFTVTFAETGGNVVATGSGSFNLTGLQSWGSEAVGYNNIGVGPDMAILANVPAGTPYSIYRGISGPTSFGIYRPGTVSSVTGDHFGLNINYPNAAQAIYVPFGYASGAPLAATLTWNSTSFTSLGLTPGTYSWNWGSGGNADSFIIQIGASNSVPEPASFALLGAGLLGLGALRRARG